MQKLSISALYETARNVRLEVIKMIYEARSGHTAGSLSSTDIICALYFKIMTHDPSRPDWEDRDRFILSNGHVCPALYAAMALSGYYDISLLKKNRSLGSPLQGHPVRKMLPGIETTSGPLGEGLGQAVGIALAARMDDKRFRIYCLSSDGEHDEGSHWEAVETAAKYQLSNLSLFVDRNRIQLSGFTRDIMPLEPLTDKYRSFGWNVIGIDGHNMEEIVKAVDMARIEYEKPSVVIANTVAGKGVSFMEDNWEWHGRAPNEEEMRKALRELKRGNKDAE